MKFLDGEWSVPLFFVIRILVYSAILAVIATVIALILKYLENLDIDSNEEVISVETDHLIGANKPISCKYGTYDDQEDVETGNGTRSYSDESIDGNICIICYDGEKNCFFVPCGHCATCQSCADRIVNEDVKRCPVCRRFIGRVKKAYHPYKSKLGWLRAKVLGDHLAEKSESVDVAYKS